MNKGLILNIQDEINDIIQKLYDVIEVVEDIHDISWNKGESNIQVKSEESRIILNSCIKNLILVYKKGKK